jgi:lambda family phage portal protein
MRIPFFSRSAPSTALAVADRVEPEARRETPSSVRMYKGAEFNRLNSDWAAFGTSQDAEVRGSLRTLRNRSRSLVRDNDYAKNAVRQVRLNVIGKGVALKPKFKQLRGDKLNEAANTAAAKAWKRWTRAATCHTGGTLSFQEIERLAITALAESGEVIIRKIYRSFGGSRIPFALEVIESDQLIDEYNGMADNGDQIRMGVQSDQWGRPTFYWFYPRHPGDYQFQGNGTEKYLKVPADEIIHLYITDRPGQTRGIPWMHTAMQRMRHMGGFEEAEVIKARGQASMMGFIVTPDGDAQTTTDANGERVSHFEPGRIDALGPGEDFRAFAPTSPGGSYDPFIRSMLRGVAAGLGQSYAPLSGDYSQTNYSSSRLALMTDRDNWQTIQQWFIAAFHQNIFEAWLDASVMSGALTLPYFEMNRNDYVEQIIWSPRTWGWIDPYKEAQAYRVAVRSGFMTLEQAIEENSNMSLEEYFEQRQREVELARELGIVLDTDPSQVNEKGIAQRAPNTMTDGAATDPDAIENGADADSTAGAENDDDGGNGTETETEVAATDQTATPSGQ